MTFDLELLCRSLFPGKYADYQIYVVRFLTGYMGITGDYILALV